MDVPHLASDAPPDAFPNINTALVDPNGLLATGGDLSAARLLAAYERGIFPWYNPGQPILWWSPNPRTVFRPNDIHISRRFRSELRKTPFTLTLDEAFSDVMYTCATTPREGQDGTWITQGMYDAYCHLHTLGYAHSIEVWAQSDQFDQVLVGGLYGISIGNAFFGESMFSHATNASKTALVYLGQQLARWGFTLLDAQVASDHLFRMGAAEIPRQQFQEELRQNQAHTSKVGKWQFDTDFELKL